MQRRASASSKMGITKLVFLIFLTCLCGDLQGQKNEGVQDKKMPVTEERDAEALATEYLELKNMKESVDKAVQRVVDNIALQFPDANKSKLHDSLEQEIGWGAMGNDLLKLTSETYSVEELEALIEFYSSPVGRAAVLKNEYFSNEFNKILMAGYNEAFEKMPDNIFEPSSETTKQTGDEMHWTEYKRIDSDDCVSIPFVGRTCHTVKYKFEFRGQVAYVDHEGKTYDVLLTSAKVVPQEFVSAMYWTYKARAQAWADQQERRSVGFEYVH